MARPNEIVSAFEERFSVRLCASAAEIEACQRVRRQVYCVERDWGDEVEVCDGREVDDYDARAAHAYLNDAATGRVVGCVRLILPSGDPENPRLQLQELSPSPLLEAPADLPMAHLGEVSRFSIARRWIGGAGDDGARAAPMAMLMRNLSVGLMRGVVMMARAHGVTHLCAAMEPALLALLARYGVVFEPLGPVRRYHGLRQPCYCSLEEVEDRMRILRPDFHPLIFGEQRDDAQ